MKELILFFLRGQVEIPFCDISSKMGEDLWFDIVPDNPKNTQISGEICINFSIAGIGGESCKMCNLFLGKFHQVFNFKISPKFFLLILIFSEKINHVFRFFFLP